MIAAGGIKCSRHSVDTNPSPEEVIQATTRGLRSKEADKLEIPELLRIEAWSSCGSSSELSSQHQPRSGV